VEEPVGANKRNFATYLVQKRELDWSDMSTLTETHKSCKPNNCIRVRLVGYEYAH
jgi:hypothetical protein